MANKRIYSKPGPNGKTLHYNSNGKFVGSSFKSFNGNVKHFDAKGKYVGTSFTAPSGAIKHFDANGKYQGASIDSALGGQIHFDAKGRPSGKSSEGFGGRYASVFPDSDDTSVETSNKYTAPATTNAGGALNSITTAIGVISFLIIVVGLLVLLWDILWPLLFLGIILLLVVAAKT